MIKYLFVFLILASGFSSSKLFTQSKSGISILGQFDTTFNNYLSVTIGSQIWMSENLCKDIYNNGDKIPEAKSKSDWELLCSAHKGCFYKLSGTRIYYYNIYAITDPRGLAPEGWHIPDESEWDQLCTTLGGSKKAGQKMKSTETEWKKGKGTNESGFSALPFGYYNAKDGKTINAGFCGYWWCNPLSHNSLNFNEIGSIKIVYVYRLTAWFYKTGSASFGLSYKIIKKEGKPEVEYISSPGLTVRCLKDDK